MNHLKQTIITFVVGVSFIAFVPTVHAIPTFQVYGSGAMAMDDLGEMDTWFLSNDPFTLVVVGAYKSNVTSLDKITLFISVPEDEMGTISFSNLSDGIPTLLTTTGSAPNANPTGNATENILTDVAGLDGYDARSQFEPFGLNNHAPTADATSDFLLYDLGSFSNTGSNLNDYNADGGTISATSAIGEEREYSVSITGFSRVHFDVYGLVTTETGPSTNLKISTAWTQNPGSHDTTWTPGTPPPPPPPVIPEPGSMVLLGSGLVGAFGYKRSSRKKRT